MAELQSIRREQQIAREEIHAARSDIQELRTDIARLQAAQNEDVSRLKEAIRQDKKKSQRWHSLFSPLLSGSRR
ncbi:MAG: hypothetical protein KF770_17530 [Anaerolineae bacterium]|nr:hypothetical protein [Anaerolineae bacterium]